MSKPRGCTRCAQKPPLPLSDRAPYVLPWVNGADITRFADRRYPPLAGEPGGAAWSWQWIVCPACLCVSRIPRRHGADDDAVPACQAPPDAEIGVLRTRRVKLEDGKKVHMICGDAVWLGDLSPGINRMLESVFILKGLAAVIDVLDNLGPVELGFDDPGGYPHEWRLGESRPKSIKRKHKRRRAR